LLPDDKVHHGRACLCLRFGHFAIRQAISKVSEYSKSAALIQQDLPVQFTSMQAKPPLTSLK
jgi:hypothetical protein